MEYAINENFWERGILYTVVTNLIKFFHLILWFCDFILIVLGHDYLIDS